MTLQKRQQREIKALTHEIKTLEEAVRITAGTGLTDSHILQRKIDLDKVSSNPEKYFEDLEAEPI